jgi:flagellar export protein FliJ
MRKFVFRLHKVQSLRHQEVKLARLALAAANGRLRQCDDRPAAIEQMAAECRQDEHGAPTAALAQGLLRGLETARARAAAARTAAERTVDGARAAWLQRRSAAAAVDKLRQAREQIWRQEVMAAEQAEIEEGARAVAARRRARCAGDDGDAAERRGEVR